MSMIERHGGIWVEERLSAKTLVSEEYDQVLDSITSIYQRKLDGHYECTFCVKPMHNNGSQWSMPFWSNIAGQGIFGRMEEAFAHLQVIKAKYANRKSGA